MNVGNSVTFNQYSVMVIVIMTEVTDMKRH